MKLRFLLAGLLIATAPLFAHADEASVRKAAEGFFKQSAIDSVNKLPVGGLYEIVLADGKILYTDEAFSYVHIGGELVTTQPILNLTEVSKQRISHVDFASLPFKQAFKRVHGKGSRKIALFEDPNCVYCKKLEGDLQNLDDVTIYTFPIAILNEDSITKAKQLWCADDKGGAWSKWMLEGKLPAAKSCADVIDENGKLAVKVHISGTPTIIMADGSRIVGYVTRDKIEAGMATAAAALEKAKTAK